MKEIAVISLKIKEDKLSAIEKFINGDGTLIMFHYSSCCQSTLSEWFKSIKWKLHKQSREWNSTIQHIEITHDFHESFGMKISGFIASNSDKMFAICFGDPIKRILAQYDKEWRWGCKISDGCGTQTYMKEYNKSRLTMDNYMSLTENHAHFNLLPTQRFAAIDFNDFLYRIVRFEIEQKSQNDKLYQMYLNNYYLWSLCCWSEECNMFRDVEMAQMMNECMESAKSTIKMFDIVFVKTWIEDLRVQHFVNELFFKDNNVDQKSKFVGVKRKKNTVSKMGNNHMFDPDNEELLDLLNKYDILLYEWIQDLVFNRTHVVWQRAKYNKNHRNELVYDLGYEHILKAGESSFE